MKDETKRVHGEAVVIDATCPLLREPEYIDWYIQGGCTAVAPTVGGAAALRTRSSRWLSGTG